MIKLETRIKLNELENISGITGLYLIRLATKIPMTSEVARDTVINHLKSEIEIKYRDTNNFRKENLIADLEVLRKTLIVYDKIDHYEGDYGSIEYHQMVLNITDEEREKARTRNTNLGNFAYRLMQDIYNIYGDSWKIPACPMADFVYTFADIKPDRRISILMIGNNDQSLNKFIEQEYKPNNHIAVSFDANVDKCYNRSSIIKMDCKITDTLQEAFDNKTNGTLGIDQHDSLFGRFSFFTYQNDRHGGIRIKILYKNKPKLLWHKDMAVFYDGEKALEDARPYFDIWEKRGIKQIDVLQFCRNKDFFYQDSIGHIFLANKLVLLFLNQDKISLPRTELALRNGRGFNGRVVYNPGKNQKKVYLEIGIGNRSPNVSQYFGSIVIPVDSKNIQRDALRVVTEMIKFILPVSDTIENINFSDCFETYKKYVLDLVGESQPDTLSEWFKYCTRASKQNDDNIVKAYERMKKSLEKEYKELGTYLNHYDFSKCMPVPRITTDEKLIENCYKCLHIEPKTVIINSINNKNIKSIQEVQPTISFMVIDKRGRLLKGDYSINKFYNNKTNEVELLYNKLKGEVVRDKIENRR